MDKRELILEATLQLVLQEGFYHLNMKKVAKGAGVAAGTIYLYFSSKEQLITELFRYVLGLFLHAVMAVAVADTDPAATIQRMMRRFLEFYLQRPDCFSFFQQYRTTPFIFKDNEEVASLVEPLLGWVEQARQAGILKNLPAHMLLGLVLGPINEMVHAWQVGVLDLPQPAVQAQLLQACWENIAGPAANVAPGALA